MLVNSALFFPISLEPHIRVIYQGASPQKSIGRPRQIVKRMGYRNLEKFVNGYRNLAVTLMNTLVAILIVNLVLSIIFIVRDRSADNPVESIYGGSVLLEVYPGMSASEIDDLLAETWSRPHIYQPFTQFRERTFAGRYVNVSAEGYRVSREQGPWPPAEDSLNVFLFGGSTTFGYGVNDDQTIASYLQPFLAEGLNRDVRVYNFGQGHYYSTQERIQFTELLASGAVPDVALFIDGLYDFYFAFDEPLFTERFRNFASGDRCAECSRTFRAETSIGRLANGLSRRISGISADDQKFAQKTNVE